MIRSNIYLKREQNGPQTSASASANSAQRWEKRSFRISKIRSKSDPNLTCQIRKSRQRKQSEENNIELAGLDKEGWLAYFNH